MWKEFSTKNSTFIWRLIMAFIFISQQDNTREKKTLFFEVANKTALYSFIYYLFPSRWFVLSTADRDTGANNSRDRRTLLILGSNIWEEWLTSPLRVNLERLVTFILIWTVWGSECMQEHTHENTWDSKHKDRLLSTWTRTSDLLAVRQQLNALNLVCSTAFYSGV